MEWKDKIEKFIDDKGITVYELSIKTGISQSTFSKILNGIVKKPNIKNCDILEKYFLENPKNNILKEPSSKYAIQNKGVPYYDIDFVLSFLGVENSSQNQPDAYIDHPFFKGCDYVVRASGQSMAKVISHGDAIGIINIENWYEFFPFGEIYAIVTRDGFRMIKVISAGKDKDHYTLISKPTDSKKDEFPPQQIKKNSILSIFKVQASSHLF